MNWSRIIFILVLIPLGISNCDVSVGGAGLPFFDNDTCGDAEFGLTHGGGKSLQRECGTVNSSSIVDRSALADVCLANLFHSSHRPRVIDNTNNVGYHTVFKVGSDIHRSILVRFNAEYVMSSLGTTDYVIRLAPAAYTELCTEADTHASPGGGHNYCVNYSFIPVHFVTIDSNFFTDFKLHVGNDQQAQPCDKANSQSCLDALCVYVAMNPEARCLHYHYGHFAIRIKPDGNSNVYKTIGYPVVVIGSYGSSDQKKDHYYYVNQDNIVPLLVRAQCSIYCADNSSDNAYCQDDGSCPAGFTSTDSNSVSFNQNLIGDYTYFIDGFDSSQTICEKLYISDKAAYASTNIIFDDRMGGKPHCHCALGYRWNVQIQICEKCQNGSSSIVCPRPCYNMCEPNEDCVIDTYGVGQCVCKAGHTMLSTYGGCKKHISCDNGIVTVSNGELICECNDRFNKSKDGVCTENSPVKCYDNLPACADNYNNDTTCVCRDGSVIHSGTCVPAKDCDSCVTNEECFIDGSSVNCTCADDYTRVNSSDTCFHTLSCGSNETLRVTEEMGFICNCKEGYLKSDDGVCLDPNGPCYNMCERNEDCAIDNNGLEQCVCKPGHTLVSIYGNCKKHISCDNGTLTVSNDELICKCKKGFEKSQDGICVDISSVNCYDDLPACTLNDENDLTCMCPNGSFIESGMCPIDCSDCGTDEECTVDESGNINCTCMKDYTRINSSDSCFHILSCPLNETLRVTEEMGFICNCKEGYLKSDEGDAIVCLDYSNHKFIRVFCVLWLIVVMAIH